MELEKYSFGTGDRFARQGRAQLQALIKAKNCSLDIVPVWNKSHREHTIIGSCPDDVRKEADKAVSACNWKNSYYVDADHINMNNVDLFIESSNFFTLDVADFISQRPDEKTLKEFVGRNKKYTGKIEIPPIENALNISEQDITAIGEKFLTAINEAGKIYRRICQAKGADDFITEISMDESDRPQSPAELFFILARKLYSL